MSDYFNIASITQYSKLYGKSVNNGEFLHYIKNVNVEEWRLGGKLHREDGPARIYYNENGTVMRECYYQNGKRHREDGPAIIYYYRNGTVDCKHYYLNGKLHREEGPASIYYNEDGIVDSEEYYLNGVLQK